MLAGTTIGRRFTLLHPVPHSLEGVQRWVAEDTRLAQRVNLDILEGPGADKVRRSAAASAKVRDPRLPRVLSSGVHSDDEGRATYIVTERSRGVSAATLVARGQLPPAAAAALVGEAARALEVAAAEGIHHGYLRAEALTVTPAGRVLVAGLGIDKVVADQVGLATGDGEADDAASLAKLYARAVTGRDVATLTAADVPAGLGSAGTSLLLGVVAGETPATLAEVSRAMGSPDARALRVASSAPASVTTPASPVTPSVESVGSPPSAPSAPSAGSAPSAPTPDTAPAGVIDETASDVEEEVGPHAERALAHTKDAPLEMLDEIVAEQHARRGGSLWQILLERLHGWWPNAEPVTEALERARERAERPAPLNVGPLILGIAVVVVIVASIVAFNQLTTVTRPEGFVPSSPSPGYPEFTFSPSPEPSPSGEE